MVSAPNPPGSRASISPPGAVFEMAPAHVLQGAVRLHGLTSSPTPDTQVRVACACAAVAPTVKAIARNNDRDRNLAMTNLLLKLVLQDSGNVAGLCSNARKPRDKIGFFSSFPP